MNNDKLMGNKEVTKGTFKTVEEFMKWYDYNETLYLSYLKACAELTYSDITETLIKTDILNPLSNSIVGFNDRYFLQYDGFVHEAGAECKELQQSLIDITDILKQELSYGGSYEAFLRCLQDCNYNAAGDIISYSLFGYAGTIVFQEPVIATNAKELRERLGLH